MMVSAKVSPASRNSVMSETRILRTRSSVKIDPQIVRLGERANYTAFGFEQTQLWTGAIRKWMNLACTGHTLAHDLCVRRRPTKLCFHSELFNLCSRPQGDAFTRHV